MCVVCSCGFLDREAIGIDGVVSIDIIVVVVKLGGFVRRAFRRAKARATRGIARNSDPCGSGGNSLVLDVTVPTDTISGVRYKALPQWIDCMV